MPPELTHIFAQYPWLRYVLRIAGLTVGAFVLRAVVLRQLRHWAARTASTLDDALVDLLDHAIKPILVLTVLVASLNLLPLSDSALKILNKTLSLAILVIALYFGVKTALLLVNGWLERTAERKALREPVTFATKIIFAGLAMMVVLDNLGVSLTAVWTTLGVGSVAVALALQDTLSNFFAGIYLRLDSPVRIGDYIKLDSNDEGFVVRLGWRSTRIRMLANNLIVVPNSKLAAAIVTNYSLPEPEMSLQIRVNVSYDTDPDQVERILIEEAVLAAGQIEGLKSDPMPFVRFIPGFGESSLEFTLICRVSTFVDQYLAQHELRKRILARFRKEGILIPYPQRVLHIQPSPISIRSDTEGGGKR